MAIQRQLAQGRALRLITVVIVSLLSESTCSGYNHMLLLLSRASSFLSRSMRASAAGAGRKQSRGRVPTKRARMSTTMSTASTSSSTTPYYSLDGSQGEGGGQILRNAISYACIFQKSIEITKIRAKRSKPGLKAQHLTGIELCAEIGGGTLEGANLNSMDIIYHHSSTNNGGNKPVYTGTINTAGSICLLLQAALPCVLFSPSYYPTTRLVLKGGTNADMAPQYDYWEQIVLPILIQKCFPNTTTNNEDSSLIKATVIKRGYFPKGGGHVEVECNTGSALVDNTPISAFEMTDPGTLEKIHIRSFHAGKLPKHLATQMAKSAENYLKQNLDLKKVAVSTEIVTETNAVGSGLGILVVATTNTGCKLGGSILCKPKQKAKEAGITAAQELVKALQQGGCVDEWLQDQMILYMALANGTSKMLTGCLTLHTQTAIDVAKQLVPGVEFEVQKLQEDKDGSGAASGAASAAAEDHYGQEGLIPGKHLITCKGIGYKVKSTDGDAGSEE